MSPCRWIFGICLLSIGHLSVAGNNRRSCQCIVDELDRYYGHFMCRSLNLTKLRISEFQDHQCMNISVASLEQNRLTDYPLLLKDRRFITVNLSGNKLRLLPRTDQLSNNLRSLDVSWNKISYSTDELRNMTGLKTLILSGNSLRLLEFLPNPCGLEELDLSSNSISSINSSLRRCTSLTKLDLSRNRLTSLPREAFGSLRYLETLHLDQNAFTTLIDGTFIGLSYLQRLSLTYAAISDLRRTTFTGLVRLEYLDLSRNNLDWLPSDAFRELPNLRDLFLENNQLTSLPDDLLSNLIRLKQLDLKQNNFVSLPLSLILEDRPSSIVILMKENPILPRSLRWLLSRTDVHKDVEEQCNCGVIARQNIAVLFCIDVQCGVGKQHRDWQDAVRSIQDGANAREEEDNLSNFAL